MKKLKMLIILLPLIIFVTGCEEKQTVIPKDEVKQTSTPLLFEVTKDGSDTKLYLFGSMHAVKEEMYPLPDYVLNAYKESDAIAVEFDLIAYTNDLKAQLAEMEKYVIPNGNKITDYMDQETYEKSVAILERTGLYNPIYDYYYPLMWFSLIENAAMIDAKLYSSYGIDNHMLRKAKDDNKEIIELESANFQTDLLLGVDNKLMSFMVKATVLEYDVTVESLKEMYEQYKLGNKEKLVEQLKDDEDIPEDIAKGVPKEIIDGYADFNDKLGSKRNVGMFNKLDKYFSEGKNVFFTVGLAHIIGTNSIIEQLESSGYTVKQIK